MNGPSQTPTGRAVIYIPHRREQERWERVCHQDVIERGERLVGVIVGQGDGERWRDAQAMIEGGEADVIVVGRPDHVPVEALPNIRVVAERSPGQRRRPRVIDR